LKVLVVSDTHGNVSKAISEIKKYNDIELVIHLGDYISDAKKIGDETKMKIECVKGNLDAGQAGDESKVLEIEGHRLYITHGHKENVKYGLTKLYFTAESKSCDIALFGHSHMPVNEEYNNIIFINPGSIAQGRNGSKNCYATLQITKEKVEVEFIAV